MCVSYANVRVYICVRYSVDFVGVDVLRDGEGSGQEGLFAEERVVQELEPRRGGARLEQALEAVVHRAEPREHRRRREREHHRSAVRRELLRRAHPWAQRLERERQKGEAERGLADGARAARAEPPSHGAHLVEPGPHLRLPVPRALDRAARTRLGRDHPFMESATVAAALAVLHRVDGRALLVLVRCCRRRRSRRGLLLLLPFFLLLLLLRLLLLLVQLLLLESEAGARGGGGGAGGPPPCVYGRMARAGQPRKETFQTERRPSTTGRLSRSGAVAKWSSMSFAPSKNSSILSKPYCSASGSIPTAEQTL
mmetsp:Transcript_18730/g.61154  ORF Transcript_18730/g.61154 Transcript_18730/m.61154 type:complete len:311 (+) Transcript_18730:1130-2062(+)